MAEHIELTDISAVIEDIGQEMRDQIQRWRPCPRLRLPERPTPSRSPCQGPLRFFGPSPK